ncbi:MAG: hypothetical protein V3U57_03430 [Robiginitomaculum sp.]
MLKKTILVTLLGTLVLSACGIRGELKTPPPLWGDKDKQVLQKVPSSSPSDKQNKDNKKDDNN